MGINSNNILDFQQQMFKSGFHLRAFSFIFFTLAMCQRQHSF